MEIMVDNRESALIPLLQGCAVQQLDVGDIWIVESHPSPLCCIERKTTNDLWNSFKDGRYSNQKERLRLLRDQYPDCDIFYIIEGKISDHNALLGAYISLQKEPGFFVLTSANVKDTAKLVGALRTRYEAAAPKKAAPAAPPTKLRPADQCTPDRWFMHALCCIPQISTSAATAICDHYGGELRRLMKDVDENGMANLAKIPIGARCLGKVKAGRIMERIIYAKE